MHNTRPEPGKRDPEGRRKAIVSAAASIIASEGPTTLTHRAVATRAGVSLGSTTHYFSSLDELRDAAFVQLANEIDESLNELGPSLTAMLEDPERAATKMLEYLSDTRAVQADIALIANAATDARMRDLAQRWNDRLVSMLIPHIGAERAQAITVYLDGAIIHAALNDAPLTHGELCRAIRALSSYPCQQSTAASSGQRPAT